jgi:hypothetical protein
LNEELKMSGGGPAQKRKIVSMAEVRAYDTDPDTIKALFALTVFDLMGWLNSLNKEQLTEYVNLIERDRTLKGHIQGIVDRVPSYALVKARTISILCFVLFSFMFFCKSMGSKKHVFRPCFRCCVLPSFMSADVKLYVV